MKSAVDDIPSKWSINAYIYKYFKSFLSIILPAVISFLYF